MWLLYMHSNKELNSIVTELFIRGRELNIFYHTILFCCTKKHQPKFYALFSHENSKRAKTSTNYPSRHSSWWRRFNQDEYVRLGPTSSEDVFKTSSRRIGQDQHIRLGHTSSRRLAKTSSKHLQEVLQKRLQDIFKMSCKGIFKTVCSCQICNL